MLFEIPGVIAERADRIRGFDQDLTVGVDREGRPPKQNTLLR